MSSRRTFLTFLVGVLLVQSAWIIAMPAFRGPDEFDHVYRAEGVSHGAFLPGASIPTAGLGELTPVRTSVIEAASGVCAHYAYPLYYNCHPWEPGRPTWNQVASRAGRYNPSYYLIVGTVGRFFDGTAVDYAIRIVSALGCALLLAWACTLWVRRGGSGWRTLGLLTALSPVLLFSTSIAAPNGISYAAGVLLWVAALDLIRADDPPDRRSLSAAAVGAVLLCNTHTTGPLWLLLIGLAFLVMAPRRTIGLLRARVCRPWFAVILLGLAGSVGWTLLSKANIASQATSDSGTPIVSEFIHNEILWMLQSIAAFPLRDEPAPGPVYGLWLIPFALVLLLAVRDRGRSLAGVGWVALAAIGTATTLTLITYAADGYAWQGRYGLPLTVGLTLVPTALTKSNGPIRPLLGLSLVALAVATGISVWHVADSQREFLQRPWSSSMPAGAAVVGLLAIAGIAVMAGALHGRSPNGRPENAELP